MSQYRVTKIVTGAPGTDKYHGTTIDAYAARDLGLLRHSMWLWNVKVGDRLQIPSKEIDEVIENCKGLCELELEHPKYANHHVGTDVYPFEIIEWKNERTIVVREMDVIGRHWPDGHCDSYKSNPENPLITLRERKNGGWNEAGAGNHCPYILSDNPYFYYDPCF